MAAAVGIHHYRMGYLAIFYSIQLKLSGVTKMLEHLTVFISYCDFHLLSSFLLNP